MNCEEQDNNRVELYDPKSNQVQEGRIVSYARSILDLADLFPPLLDVS